MKLKTETSVNGCHLVVTITTNGALLQRLRDNGQGEINVLQGVSYVYQWHAIAGGGGGHYDIESSVDPENAGFPPLKVNKDLAAGERADGVFIFSL
ncbi:hypothetical protein CJD36_018675 [Flavipsychrobacter stenotrophus]|uniref:Uncharacterized protein n=1 Tax=Flavipsychrobacter stenotrophus TaxID=2077091 RepID=A0A2S7SRP0_9BACT|nr:hypothetical protein [Flavipsychrobacter stenotrophus]PQJ09275.1 hypothetical protein CJD36_018675 [Flavipsychrobacter stenotrophus]